MVSPLRTWQHTEPKSLWPALGGLAVVAHVGIIGLALPYIARLTEGEDGSASAVVPIELIVTADSASNLAASNLAKPNLAKPNLAETTKSARGDNALANEQSTQKSAPIASDVSSPAVERSPAVAENPISETPLEESSKEPPVAKQNRQDERLAESEAPLENAAPAGETPSEAVETEDTTSQGEASSAGREAETISTEDLQADEAGDLPTLDGAELPSHATGPTGEGADQLTSLRFTGHDYVPDSLRQDRFAIVLPQPNFPEPNEMSAAAVRPQDVGCGEVGELSPLSLTYRVTISEAGTIQEATPWTGSSAARSLNESEKAIACLLAQSGWRFAPAIDEDGEAIRNSDLVITFDLDLTAD